MNQFGLKRKSVRGKYWWTISYNPDLIEQIEDTLDIYLRRKSIDKSWKYLLFPAKGEYRRKTSIESLLSSLETPIELPEVITFADLIPLINKATEEKNKDLLAKLKEAGELIEEGSYEEAKELADEVAEELSKERTFTFLVELRDEWQT